MAQELVASSQCWWRGAVRNSGFRGRKEVTMASGGSWLRSFAVERTRAVLTLASNVALANEGGMPFWSVWNRLTLESLRALRARLEAAPKAYGKQSVDVGQRKG